MIVQKSNFSSGPTLYLVPTPIGNFNDMTFRAVETLKSVDFVFAEDTRVTKVLLSHFKINIPLSSYHIFNEDTQADEILALLQNGHSIAMVSDAGMPSISDPGYLITKKAIEAGVNVIALPGASAALTALVGSGLPCEKFTFVGFLNRRRTARIKELQSLADRTETLIFYEAPHRFSDTLADLLSVLGNRPAVIARELTKKFEEYTRGNLADINAAKLELKGEMVIVVRGAESGQIQIELGKLSIEEHYEHYLKQNPDPKEAMKKVAKDRNLSKSDVYKALLPK